MNSFSKFSVHPNPKEALEICLLRMLTFNPLQKLSNKDEAKKVETSEKKNSIKHKLEPSKDNGKSKESITDKSNDGIIKNDNDWVTFFNNSKMSPFARNYFGNMAF